MLKPILGGLLLGLGTGLMMLLRGRIAGCSGMMTRTIFPWTGFDRDSLWFVLGLIISGLMASLFCPLPNPLGTYSLGYAHWLGGGFLVGLGAFIGSGCTSGHGLCGLAMRRKRSVVAVMVFFALAILTVRLIH